MEKTPKRSLEEMVVNHCFYFYFYMQHYSMSYFYNSTNFLFNMFQKFGKSSSKGSYQKQSSPQSHSDREKDYVHAASSAPSSSQNVTDPIPPVVSDFFLCLKNSNYNPCTYIVIWLTYLWFFLHNKKPHILYNIVSKKS